MYKSSSREILHYRAQNLDLMNHARYEVLEDQSIGYLSASINSFLQAQICYDVEDAPRKEKVKFLETLKKEAQASVSGILKKLTAEECPVCQRMSVRLP